MNGDRKCTYLPGNAIGKDVRKEPLEACSIGLYRHYPRRSALKGKEQRMVAVVSTHVDECATGRKEAYRVQEVALVVSARLLDSESDMVTFGKQ